ncbi:MAG TPA: Flp family type IVb pilin [Allosphingosinicella sp.]|jgi:pilus assembly protein Flp/PilA
MRLVRTILRDRKGGTAIEYALVATLIAVAAIAAFNNLGKQADSTLNNVGAAIDVTKAKAAT